MTAIAIWILGFGGLLAQAEQAPPEPDPGSPAGRESAAPPAPSPAAAPSGPAEPAPPEGSPQEQTSSASATPSPAAPASPVSSEPLRPPRYTLSLLGGFSYRLGTGGPSGLGPAPGFSLGGSFERRYASPAPGLEVGVAIDFIYDQSSQGAAGASNNANRTFTNTTFGALQTFGVRVAPLHIWGGAGGGLSVGYFSTPEVALLPGSSVAYLPFARGAAGVDFAINEEVALGLRASYTFMLTNPSYTTHDGQTFHLFGDLLDIQGGLFYRFQ